MHTFKVQIMIGNFAVLDFGPLSKKQSVNLYIGLASYMNDTNTKLFPIPVRETM